MTSASAYRFLTTKRRSTPAMGVLRLENNSKSSVEAAAWGIQRRIS